ncbi:MAG: hypothetical protein IPO31_05825 [Candidatus Obscuribacter sp.]|nr:hypothetical protein [Candidatus Obscuribacter sp.]
MQSTIWATCMGGRVSLIHATGKSPSDVNDIYILLTMTQTMPGKEPPRNWLNGY